MKSLVPVLSLFIVMITFNACKKNADTAVPPPSTSSMSYKVGGVVKTMRFASANNNGNFIIGGISDKESGSLQITIQAKRNSIINKTRGVEIGTFDLEKPLEDGLSMEYFITSAKVYYYGIKGGLKITYLTDSRVKGTFNFTGMEAESGEEKAITDGVFDCEIKKLY